MSEQVINFEAIQKAFDVWHDKLKAFKVASDRIEIIGDRILPAPFVFSSNEELNYYKEQSEFHAQQWDHLHNLYHTAQNKLADSEAALMELLEWGSWYRVRFGYIRKISRYGGQTVGGRVILATDEELLNQLQKGGEES